MASVCDIFTIKIVYAFCAVTFSTYLELFHVFVLGILFAVYKPWYHIISFVTAANLKFKFDSDEDDDDDNFELHDNSLENGDHVPVHDAELDVE